jgi:hypothetical protein
MALLLDIGAGTPTGFLRFIFVPYTALAILVSLLRAYSSAYFLDKTPPSTL